MRRTPTSYAEPAEPPRARLRPVRVIDTDVHPVFPVSELAEYVAEPYRSRYLRKNVGEVVSNALLYSPPSHALRVDAAPPGMSGTTAWETTTRPAGSDPAFVDRQLLQEAGIDFAILIFMMSSGVVNPELDQAILAAHNAWIADTWLGRYNWHGRYRGSIRVDPYDTAGAVREIERWAGHPYIAQVHLFPDAAAPYGQPRFLPLFEAAARAGMPVAFHPKRAPGLRVLTPTGFPAYHLEGYTQWPLYTMSHLASLVFEGVFERLPTLRLVCVEGGFSWALPFLWRLDAHWRELRGEVPHVRRPPSEYVRECVRFTTQPLEEPEPGRHLTRVMEMLDAGRLLMFSSDYPHYDYDDPGWIQPRLPREARDRIMFRNAAELYGLPLERPVDALDEATDR